MEDTTTLRHKGLQTRGKFLIILIPLMLISLALMTFVGIYYVQTSARRALEKSLRQTADIAAGRIADRVDAHISLATSIASRIGELYVDKITSPYDMVACREFEAQMIALGKTYGFMHMYVIDTAGHARTQVHSNVANANPPFYQPILNGAPSYMSDPTLDTGKFKGQYKLNIVVPVNDASGRYIGMLVCMVNADRLSQIVSDIRVGAEGSTFIMDNRGNCIAHPDKSMLYAGKSALKIKNNPEYASLNQFWKDMNKNPSGYSKYEYKGARLAAYRVIQNTNNWALAVSVSESEFMAPADSAVQSSVMIALFTTLICTIVIVKFLNHITMRISNVAERLETLARGKLSTKNVRVQTSDEIGRLEAASNKLNADLQQVIDRIETSLREIAEGNLIAEERAPLTGDFATIDRAIVTNKKKLSEMMQNISRTAEEVSRGSEQMANGAASLAQGAAEQASSVEELFTSVTDISQKAQELGSSKGRKLPSEDDDGEDPSAQNEGNYETAVSLTEKLLVAMTRISAASQSIGKITANINSLASETSMLALNASVEATHAGEFGKGFAVIAAEIRALSRKSLEAAKTTETMLNSIMKTVSRGNQIVEYTVDSVDDMVTAIAQFKSALEQISNVIENTAATAEESASNCEELTTQASVLREMISEFTYERGKEEGNAQ